MRQHTFGVLDLLVERGQSTAMQLKSYAICRALLLLLPL
jgi:hypothetical protein